MSDNYQLYRRTTIGIALTDALDEMIQDGQMDPQHAIRVLSLFDASIVDALHNKVKAKMSLTGHLNFYNSCDDVWVFVVDKPKVKCEAGIVSAEKIKIVACNGGAKDGAGAGKK